MASQKQIVANRQNAQKSTGPKSKQGKQAVRHNALRHDLERLSRGVDPLKFHLEGPSMADLEAEFRIPIQRRLRTTPLGVRHLIETLDDAAREVTDTDSLPAATETQLEREFGTGRTSLLQRIYDVLPDDDEADDTVDTDGIPLEEAAKKAVLKILKKERADLQSRLADVDERAQSAMDTAIAAALPLDEDVVRIQRYASMYQRQRYKAMDQLEKLQRRRTGELSVPPLTVNMHTDD